MPDSNIRINATYIDNLDGTFTLSGLRELSANYRDGEGTDHVLVILSTDANYPLSISNFPPALLITDFAGQSGNVLFGYTDYSQLLVTLAPMAFPVVKSYYRDNVGVELEYLYFADAFNGSLIRNAVDNNILQIEAVLSPVKTKFSSIEYMECTNLTPSGNLATVMQYIKGGFSND